MLLCFLTVRSVLSLLAIFQRVAKGAGKRRIDVGKAERTERGKVR